MNGALMVCGTTSDAGKSHVVTGLCRLLHRRGVRVTPFKAQNMSLNSFVTPDGAEIGRAQGVQALAAGAVPEAAMNPVLLKPTSDRASQVIVRGRPWADLEAAAYLSSTADLLAVVLDCYDDLRRRFDVVILEGAGSPAEINLFDRDIANLRVAAERDIPSIIVGDIERGGVFASLYGTVTLLPHHYRRLVRGFVINKFRGDKALLGDGPAELQRRTGVPTLGVLPYLTGVALDAEDSLALAGARPMPSVPVVPDHDVLDIVVIRLPHIANFTDLDPLMLEPSVTVRMVEHAATLGRPDLIVIPGTKATVVDLDWLRRQGFPAAIEASGADVLGICGGYQMLGRAIDDPVESGQGHVDALAWLDAVTVFEPSKVCRQRSGSAIGDAITGYQIHHGRVRGRDPWIRLDDRYGCADEGSQAVRPHGSRVLGTTLHGLFEGDSFRSRFLADLGARRGKRVPGSSLSFAAAREAQFDRLADALEAHVDVDALLAIIGSKAVPIGDGR